MARYVFVLPWSLAHLGGVNQVVINLATEMRRSRDFEPLVLVTDWSATEPHWSESHGIRIIRWRMRIYDADARWWKRLAYAVWELRFRRRFRSFCRSLEVKVINMHYPGQIAFTVNRLAKYVDPKLPLLLSFHGADLGNLPTSSPRAMLHWRALLSSVTAVVTCSHDLGRRLENIVGSCVQTTTVHNGIDVGRFLALAPRQDAVQRRMILNVGKFEMKKGQDVLIEAFNTFSSTYADVDLVLVGATDEALPSLQATVARFELGNRVHFFADLPHNEVARFFGQATVFALPSRLEPFGIVILEAGAFSLPVVATRTGGVPEILTHCETGILVAPEDHVGLALALRSLLDSPAAARRFGNSLHNHVVKNFTWASAYKKYAALCK